MINWVLTAVVKASMDIKILKVIYMEHGYYGNTGIDIEVPWYVGGFLFHSYFTGFSLHYPIMYYFSC